MMRKNRTIEQFIYIQQHKKDNDIIKVGQSWNPRSRYIHGFSVKHIYTDKSLMSDEIIHEKLIENGFIELPIEKFKGDIDIAHKLILSLGFTEVKRVGGEWIDCSNVYWL